MAPKGFMFYPVHVPGNIDLEKAIKEGLKGATYNMLKIPLPFLGVKGIRRFADKIIDWPKYARDEDFLADKIFRITIFLEDQGTGGGGFRFLYASFLQEASKVLNNPRLQRDVEGDDENRRRMARSLTCCGKGCQTKGLQQGKTERDRRSAPAEGRY